MRLVSIQGKGFGVLQERTLDTDSPFALFYGANEAGKSTLMGFVRAVLFGFPSRSNRAERYEPPMGGAHGGALTLLDEQGQRIRVERYDGSNGARRSSAGIVKVTLGDGTVGGEELLHTLLGGLSADLFRSLFAFGLSELQELRTLQSDEISGYLYSAGLGVSGSTIMEAQRKLTARADSLYKPRGRNQEINLLLKEMEELSLSIRRSKEYIGDYDRLMEERRSKEQLIARQELLKQELRRELDELTLGSKARSSWIRLRQIAEEVQELPAWPSFPEHASTRLETLEQELAQCAEEEKRLELKQQAWRSELQLLVPNEELLMYRAELNGLLEETPMYQESERTITELDTERAGRHLEIQRLLKQLDERWEQGTLAAFPVSVSIRDRIRQERDHFAELRERIRRVEGEQESLSLQMERVQESILMQERELQAANSGLLRALSMSAYDNGETEDPVRSLNRIARDYAQWCLLRSEREHYMERREERHRHREELLAAAAQAGLESAQRGRMLAFLSAGMTVFLSAGLLWRGEGVFTGVVVILGGGLSLYLYLSAGKQKGFTDKESTGRSGRSARSTLSDTDLVSSLEDEKLHKMDQQLKAYEFSLQQQAGRWLGGGMEAAAAREQQAAPRISQGASVDGWPQVLQWLETSLEDLRQEAEQWKHQSGEWTRKQDKLRDLRSNLQTLVRQDDLLTAESDELREQLANLHGQWNEWTLTLGFTAQISPDTLLESLQLIERGQEMLRRQEQLEDKTSSLKQFLSRFESDIQTYLGSAAGKESLLALKRWKEQEQEQTGLLIEQQRIRQLLLENERERQLLEERRLRVIDKLNHLLKEAFAEDGEQLRQNQSKMERLSKLIEEQKLLSGAMEALAGVSLLPKLKALLEETGEEELERRREQMARQLQALEEEINEWREQSGRLANEIEKLELGTEHTDKLQKLEEYRASLQQQVDQYAVVSFASLLVKKARDIYERDRQPGVLIRASSYFEQMTKGQYTQIKAPFGEQRLVAMQRNGRALDTNLLSRGTAEQLYLSMRFALAEEYAGKAALPLVMDDVLVNFDEQRMESCLEVLRELSGRHQILLFTCHAHVRDAAKRLIPGHRLLEL